MGSGGWRRKVKGGGAVSGRGDKAAYVCVVLGVLECLFVCVRWFFFRVVKVRKGWGWGWGFGGGGGGV